MRYIKQLQGTAIETKFASPYAILFLDYWDVKILNFSVKKPHVWWRYIDDIFIIWQHGEEKYLIAVTQQLTAEYSLDKVNFLDVEVIRNRNKLLTDLNLKPTDSHQHLEFSSCHVYRPKKLVHILYSRLSALIGFVPKIGFSIIDVTNLSAGLKIEVTMKKLSDNKFLKPGNLPGKIY